MRTPATIKGCGHKDMNKLSAAVSVFTPKRMFNLKHPDLIDRLVDEAAGL